MYNVKKTRLTLKTVFTIVLLTQCLSLDSSRVMNLITGGKWARSVSAAAATPELPRVYLDTSYVVPTGRTITVNAGSDLQAAINSAQPGDVLSLQAGATFTGNFTLPAKSGQGWIVIRTST